MATKTIRAQSSSNDVLVGVIPYPLGLWGGDGGAAFDDEGSHYRVLGVTLTTSTTINTIAFTYQEKDGSTIISPTRGSSPGPKKIEVSFDSDEILVGISGCYGQNLNDKSVKITSLTFYTNKKEHGPYGDEIGKSFACRPIGCTITGFYGFCQKLVDSIGVYVALTMQICDSLEALSMRYSLTSSARDVQQVLKGDDWKPLQSLSWGGLKSGNPWDDGTYKAITEIQISYDDLVIHTIQVQYVGNNKEGDTVQGEKHGYKDGPQNAVITLNYPNEYLMRVSGTYGLHTNKIIEVKNLKFHTNLKEYGPYGNISGGGEALPFSSPESGCKILGFCGRSGWLLDNIGVHLATNEPVPREQADAGWNEFVPARILANLLHFPS